MGLLVGSGAIDDRGRLVDVGIVRVAALLEVP